MTRNMTAGVVILAAGESKRLEGKVNKVYRNISGKPALNYSIERFLQSQFIDEIVLVFNEKDKLVLQDRVLSKFDSSIPIIPVIGGSRRQDSSLSGLEKLETDLVFIHDGARPKFSTRLIEDLLDATLEHRAAFPGVELVDTIRKKRNGFGGESLDRERYVRVQTPQCFERKLVYSAIQRSVREGRYYTDDAGAVIELSDVQPKIVEGERRNIKLTTARDIQFVETFLGV